MGMTLDDEIAWWTRKSREKDSDAGLVCFGVATGLKLAKRDYGAADMADAMTACPDDHPLMIAWKAYQATEDYKNTRYWALAQTTMRAERAEELKIDPLANKVTPEQRERYVDGSLWAAFLVGFSAAGGNVTVSR